MIDGYPRSPTNVNTNKNKLAAARSREYIDDNRRSRRSGDNKRRTETTPSPASVRAVGRNGSRVRATRAQKLILGGSPGVE